jgi:hypothetical protein
MRILSVAPREGANPRSLAPCGRAGLLRFARNDWEARQRANGLLPPKLISGEIDVTRTAAALPEAAE